MTTQTKKPHVFVLTSRLYETAGGRTKATITRTMFLQNHFDTTVVEMSSTKYPGEELPAVFAKYQTTFDAINPWYVADKKSSCMQNYLDFLREQTGDLGDKGVFNGEQKDFVLPTLSGGRIKGYLADGKIARLRLYHSDGKVDFFALDEKQNIFLRELYKKDELLARYYLNISGKVCSGFLINETGAKQFVYRTKADELIYSDSITDHNLAFLNDTLDDGDVLISDVRYYDEVLEKLKPKVRVIHVWHEIALNLSQNSGVNPAYTKITEPSFRPAEGDRMVVFTDDARDEYIADFPHLKDAFTVIPYGINVKADTSIDRDKNLVVSIGRLTGSKDIVAQIRAFAVFHKKYPSAKFDIYGEGSDSEALQQLIDDLGLRLSVTLCGFTHNANEMFQSAGMMIFSSKHETFGLTILESISNGTPVASYDVRFGAKMMINKQNGVIAKDNSPESLAEAMIKLHKSNISPQKVRKSVKNTFSQQRFEDAWLAVISDNAEGAK